MNAPSDYLDRHAMYSLSAWKDLGEIQCHGSFLELHLDHLPAFGKEHSTGSHLYCSQYDGRKGVGDALRGVRDSLKRAVTNARDSLGSRVLSRRISCREALASVSHSPLVVGETPHSWIVCSPSHPTFSKSNGEGNFHT